LEERIRKKSSARDSTFGGQKIFWNYRSEVVDKLGLDDKHKNIGIAYAVIIVLGFTAFVYVKSEVILNRKEEMEERHRIKRELKMRGENDNSGNKKLAVADS
uniref:Small integral membrane protein 8 n=1 Tax=Angiostrongylus cantonensis TaxID=6313 RepID=A0A0K0DHU8_ANGCA